MAAVLSTLFVIPPLSLAFSFAATELVLPPVGDPSFRKRLHVASGALVGLTLAAGLVLYSPYVEGGIARLLFILPAFMMIAIFCAFVSAALGWLFDMVLYH